MKYRFEIQIHIEVTFKIFFFEGEFSFLIFTGDNIPSYFASKLSQIILIEGNIYFTFRAIKILRFIQPIMKYHHSLKFFLDI